LACHAGGIPWQSNVTQPPPIPRQANGKDRQRRCDEWYEGEAACGPCDGIAGAYWGDLPDDGIYCDCEVVAKPEDVPESDRAPTAWPHAFAVEMREADRWPRASLVRQMRVAAKRRMTRRTVRRLRVSRFLPLSLCTGMQQFTASYTSTTSLASLVAAACAMKQSISFRVARKELNGPCRA